MTGNLERYIVFWNLLEWTGWENRTGFHSGQWFQSVYRMSTKSENRDDSIYYLPMEEFLI